MLGAVLQSRAWLLQQRWPQPWPRRLTRVCVSSSVSYGQCLLTCDLQEQFLHLCAAPTGTSATEGSSCRCCLRAKCLGHFICIIQSNRATGTEDQIALNHVGCDHYKLKNPKHCKGFFGFNFFLHL